MIRISGWTAFFLVLLRLAIGWHFLFEGLHKVHSTYTDKPFTSAGYFREAEGPLGSVMRRYVVGDPDEEALARLTPTSASLNALPHDRFPPALARDWQAYLDRFIKYYQLNDAQQDEARSRLRQSMDNTALWLLGQNKSELTVKETFQGVAVDVKKTVPQRVQEYRDLLAQVRELYDRKLPSFGRDVEKARLREVKAKATALRTELLGELDEQTKDMKRNLAAVVVLPLKDNWLPIPFSEGTSPDQILLYELTPARPLFDAKSTGERLADHLPEALSKRWDEFLQLFAARYRLTDEQKQRAAFLLDQAKERTARWLLDAGEDKTGMPAKVKEFERLVKEAPSSPAVVPPLRSALDVRAEDLRKALDQQIVNMKQSLAGVLDEYQKEGFAPPEPKEPATWVVPYLAQMNGIERLDWLTRWGLVVMGAGLLLGLFTRLNCLAAAGFLALTYLAMPAFASLPVPPNTEGNYFLVNKNVVELVALLTLATTASGQWFGVDRLLSATWRTIRGTKREE